jgi:hypothetical protein
MRLSRLLLGLSVGPCVGLLLLVRVRLRLVRLRCGLGGAVGQAFLPGIITFERPGSRSSRLCGREGLNLHGILVLSCVSVVFHEQFSRSWSVFRLRVPRRFTRGRRRVHVPARIENRGLARLRLGPRPCDSRGEILSLRRRGSCAVSRPAANRLEKKLEERIELRLLLRKDVRRELNLDLVSGRFGRALSKLVPTTRKQRHSGDKSQQHLPEPVNVGARSLSPGEDAEVDGDFQRRLVRDVRCNRVDIHRSPKYPRAARV